MSPRRSGWRTLAPSHLCRRGGLLAIALLVASCAAPADPRAATTGSAAPVVAPAKDGAPRPAAPTGVSASGSNTPAPAPALAVKPDARAGDPAAVKAAMDALYQKARAEGVVVWQQESRPDDVEELAKAFRQSYPGIEIQLFQINARETAQRLSAEAQAGRKPEIDLLHGNAQDYTRLKEIGVIDTSIDWTAYGVPADLIDPLDGAVLWSTVRGLTYNTSLVRPDELPRTWEELGDPKWKGRLIVDRRGIPLDGFGVDWGAEKSLDLMRRIMANDPLLTESATSGVQAVATGEVAIFVGGQQSGVEEFKKKGAPVEMDYNIEPPGLALPEIAYIVNGAQHPNAALLYAAWLATDGQTALQKQSKSNRFELPPGHKLRIFLDPADMAKRGEVRTQLMAAIEPGGAAPKPAGGAPKPGTGVAKP